MNMFTRSDLTARPATNADGEQVRALVFGILREYHIEPDPAGTDSDIADIDANYINRGGAFEVLETADRRIVGSFGLYPMEADVVELRKMYLAREFRGRGLGKAMLERVIGRAAELGFKRLHLETAAVLKEAIGLYTSFGFKPANDVQTPRCDQAFYLDLTERAAKK